MDTLAHHYEKSIFGFSDKLSDDFWNPHRSWKNKYKERGNTLFANFIEKIDNTILSFLTDGWHLFQFIMLTALQTSITLPFIFYYNLSWWQGIITIFVVKMIWGATFELFYKYILIKK